MAQKDYVARGRNNKKAPPPPKPALPWLRIVVTLLLVAGFGYFLWSIKGKAPEQQVAAEKANVTESEQPLPEIPEEEWEFIKTLPEYTVEIEQIEGDQQAHNVIYMMQCTSLRSKERAEQLKAKIAFQGLESRVKPTQGTTGMWYRVILGPYQSKRAAEKDRHTLQRAKIDRCVIHKKKL